MINTFFNSSRYDKIIDKFDEQGLQKKEKQTTKNSTRKIETMRVSSKACRASRLEGRRTVP